MKTLKEKFRMNGLLYTLIKRNDVAVLYAIGGTYSDLTTHWEVCKIYTRQDKYGKREALPTNELFGRDLSRCFINEKSALIYFDELTEKLNLLQGVPQVVTGVKDNAQVIAEYHLALLKQRVSLLH
jgi:hypothetical protein